MSIAQKTNPALWERSKARAKAKMGGKHSARAMQLATKFYKSGGGGYRGAKKKTSLSHWSKQKWKYSGKDKPGPGGSGVYLPSKKISRLKSTSSGRSQLRAAATKKAAATRSGRQYSRHGLAAGTSLRKKT